MKGSSMASTRKQRNVKRVAKIFEDWPEKEAPSTSKGKNRKRKLSDMLGSRWSKEELERFYEAYRKHGTDWKKVASTVRNRSSEMVEALFNMFKAYLSLPEGTATVAGLIAMMTDHYNINQEGSDSDKESIEASRTSRKSQKHGRGKIRALPRGSDGYSPDPLQSESASSRYGCLTLLKKRGTVGNRPRAVGKRTPRIPVSNLYNRDGKEKAILSSKLSLNDEAETVDDEGAHVAALALAEVLQRGGSPQVSRTPGRRVDQIRSSPVKSGEEKSGEPDTDRSKLSGVKAEVDYLEGSIGSREAENGDFAKDDNDGIGTNIEDTENLNKHQGKRPEVDEMENFQIDDDREACSGTEEGSTVRKMKDGTDVGIKYTKTSRVSKSSRKRSRQLFFGDESSALDALQTLADLSVNLLPASTVESESSTQMKKEQSGAGERNLPESSPVTNQRDKSKVSGKRDRNYTTSPSSDTVTRRPRMVKSFHPDANAISEMNQQACACIGKIDKRKGRLFTDNVAKSEFTSESQKSESQKTQISAEEARRFSGNVRRVNQVSPLPKQGKFYKPQDNSSSSTDPARAVTDFTEPCKNTATRSHFNVFVKSRSRRKIGLNKALSWKDFKSNESNDGRADRFSYPDSRIAEIKEKLSHCLSSKLLRRWCMFEWFYSAIDFPWFAKSEFVEYLNHVRLGHIPTLTRVEWGVIRSSLGKPRRLSKQFLKEERTKLEQYRESVRAHYADLRAGLREGLPTDLGRPLFVGQRVIACHPKTREIHGGNVLTIDRNRCRVQFDRTELGVEFVMDIDCMPLNPLDNIPEALRWPSSVLNKLYNGFANLRRDDQPKERKNGGSLKVAPNDILEDTDGVSHISTTHPLNTIMKQAKEDTIDSILQAKATVNEASVAAQAAMYSQPCTLSQIQEREADIRALADLSRALDKKEALLIELRHMNEEVSESQKDGEAIKDLEHFRKQYAMVLVQLRDANDQVASALLSLRQRNTYHGNSTHPWVRSLEISGGLSGSQDSLNISAFLSQDPASPVEEIIETSRRKAKHLVDSAVQAFSTLKDGEDAFTRISEALDSANNHNSGSHANISGATVPSNVGHGDLSNHDQTSCNTELRTVELLGQKLQYSSDVIKIPSELISSCVATLLMMQSCTERQYPPAEIAQILDSAVTSLQPSCPQNLPIYREIEACMGVIKNQMLALIPTPCSIPPEVITV